MMNYWVQTEAPMVTWIIDVRRALERPDSLVELSLRLQNAGQASGMLLAPEGDGGVGASNPVTRMRAQFASDATLSVCRGDGWDGMEASMCWYRLDGGIAEGRVRDLGALLQTLEPVPESIPTGFMALGEAPLALHGPRLRYQRDHLRLEKEPSTTTIAITTYSDIWFPFLVGAAHPWADFDRRFDNMELARRHTTRLNRFLAEARDAALAADCSWRVAVDESNELYSAWIAEEGVMLDGPLPSMMPPGAERVPWDAREH